MSGKLAYVTGGMGGIGTSICQRLAKEGFRVVAGCGPSRNYQQWLDEQAAQGYTFHASVGNVSDWDSTVKAFEGHGRTRPGGRAGQQCGHHPRRPVPQDERGRLAHGDRHQPQQPVQRDQAGHRRHGREAVGAHHQHQLGEWPEGPVRPDQLLHGQGRHPWLHDGAGAGSRQQGRDGQHDLAGLYRHGHGPRDPPDVLEKIVATIPVRRLGTPEEIASITAWLASDESGFSTGADFSLNGGLHGLTHVGPPVGGLAPGGFGEKAARHLTYPKPERSPDPGTNT